MKIIITFLLATNLFLLPVANSFFGELPEDMKVKIARFNKDEIKENELKNSPVIIQEDRLLIATDTVEREDQTSSSNQINPISSTEISPEFCHYQKQEKEVFDAKLVSVRKKLVVEQGEKYRVKVFIKNTGNTPWFSELTGCTSAIVNVGLDRPRDRYAIISDKTTNRIQMDQLKVEPNEIASFTFWQIAPRKNDVIKEYFTPVVEGVKWMENGTFMTETIVGSVPDSQKEIRQKLNYAIISGSVLDIDLSAPKKLEVVVSKQIMNVYLGDKIVRTFRVSTGKPSTPTPYGETKILSKQEVRIAAKPPHFIMPKFMMFRAGGYGMHALPSLANDRGRFWTEARSNIGRAVSHGCIRLLPEDADWLYDFTPIGTPVIVVR